MSKRIDNKLIERNRKEIEKDGVSQEDIKKAVKAHGKDTLTELIR
jgi:hypothetical protein